jgi:hypothetical protein
MITENEPIKIEYEMLKLEKKHVRNYLLQIYSETAKHCGKFSKCNLQNYLNLPIFLFENLMTNLNLLDESLITSDLFINIMLTIYFPDSETFINLIYNFIDIKNIGYIFKADLLFFIEYIASFTQITHKEHIIKRLNEKFNNDSSKISRAEFIEFCLKYYDLYQSVFNLISSNVTKVKHIPKYFYSYTGRLLKKSHTIKDDSNFNGNSDEDDEEQYNSFKGAIKGKRTLEDLHNNEGKKRLSRANCYFKETELNEPIEKKLDLFKLKTYFHLEFIADFEGYLRVKEGFTMQRVYVRYIEKCLYLFDDKNNLLKFSYVAECFVDNGISKTTSNKNYAAFNIIYADNKIKTYFCESEDERNKWYFKIKQKLNQKTVNEFYKYEGGIADSDRIKAFNKITKENNLIKIYKKTKDSNTLLRAKMQMEILNICNHPNLVKYVDYFEDKNNIFLVTEDYEYPTLKQFISSKKTPITEKEASLIISQIIDCVEYLHKKSIVLRSLDYSNVLVSETTSGLTIKIADIEYGAIIYPLQNSHERISTMHPAPEYHIADQGYNSKVDIWNIGVLLYYILTNNIPISDSFNSEVCTELNYDNINYNDLHERSDSVKDLIKKCMQINPDERISIKDLKKDNWFYLFWD